MTVAGRLCREASPFDGPTVVVAPHAPLAACLPHDHPVPGAYASGLSKLIATYRPDQWLFGHTHRPVNFRHGHTRVRNVSLGYPSEESAPARHMAAGLDGRGHYIRSPNERFGHGTEIQPLGVGNLTLPC